MNILQINTLDIKGGGSKVAYNLKNELKKRGHYSSIFVAKKFSDDKDVFYIQRLNILFKLIKKITKRDANRYIREKIDKVFASDIDFYNIKGLFKSRQYKEADIIHCHNLHGGFFNLSALKKISKDKPLVWTLHDMWAITHRCPHAFDGKEKDGFYTCPRIDIYEEDLWRNEEYLKNKKRDIYNNIDVSIITPSLWLKRKVENSILKNKNILLVHNGIDSTTIFKPYDKKLSRIKLGLPIDKKIMLFSGYGGKNNAWKGWKYIEKIISFYKNDPNIIFICIGGKNSKQELPNGKIIFIDYTDDEALIAKCYSAVDILLFPSIAENMPLTILEAMACGTPAVSFDVGGVKEIIDHKKDGYIANYCDISDLISGTEFMLNRSEREIIEMSKNAVEKIKNKFNLANMTDEYINIYQNILQNRK